MLVTGEGAFDDGEGGVGGADVFDFDALAFELLVVGEEAFKHQQAVLGKIAGLDGFSTHAIFVNRLVLDADTWAQTSTKVISDRAVRTELSEFLVNQLYARTDVTAQVHKALPPRLISRRIGPQSLIPPPAT